MDTATPSVLVTEVPPPLLPALPAWIRSRHPGARVHALRGKKCRTLASFFDEAAAALQFPVYFGDNWSAFEDCLRDIRDAQDTPMFLLIYDGEALLEGDDGALVTLLEVLLRAPDTRTQAAGGSTPAALQVLFLQQPGTLAALTGRLDALAISHQRIDDPVATFRS